MEECDCSNEMALDGCIQEKLRQYRQLYDAAMPNIGRLRKVLADLEAPLKALEGEIKACVIESGRSMTESGIEAKYTSGYIRPKWNDKALIGYGAAHPEMMAFRSTTNVRPRVTVRAGQQE